jgi:hypothetical protein
LYGCQPPLHADDITGSLKPSCEGVKALGDQVVKAAIVLMTEEEVEEEEEEGSTVMT